MKIKHVHGENFCNLKEFDADFSDNTLVCGKNESGKSSVRNLIFWVLTSKLADGSAADGIRPKDKDGKEINFIDVVGEVTTEHEGKQIIFKKTQHQKWVSHRGFSDKEYEGDETLYEINGIPKKQKDFQAFIEEIVDSETILFGTNAMAFLNLDTKKRRALLMKKCGEVSLESIVENESKYNRIKPILSDGTIDELIARSRKIIKAKNEELKTIPIRIDELSKMIVERDTAELELLKNSLMESIKEVEKSISGDNSQLEIKKLEDEEMRLTFDLNDCKRRLTEKLQEERHSLNKDVIAVETQVDTVRNEIKNAETAIEKFMDLIKTNEEEIERLKVDYKNAKEMTFDEEAWQFDESTTICSLCGQKLPDDKIQTLYSEFEVKKANAIKKFNDDRNAEIERIRDFGNGMAKANKENKELLALNKTVLETKKEELDKHNKELAQLKSKLAMIPIEPDCTNDPEYTELFKKIEAIKGQISTLNNAPSNVDDLTDRKAVLENELEGINEQLAKVAQNIQIETRISELTDKQRSVAQEIADEECTLDLLTDLSKAYIEQTTEHINKRFSFVKWIMFKENKTCDGYMEICEPCVNGIPYNKNLNHGNRLLANLDIEKSFQDMAGVTLFLTCDDCESIDEERIPRFDRQLICFRRTDDKELTVKNL